MLFVIHALDKPGAAPERARRYEDHKRFLSNLVDFDVAIVMSGPLMSDDGNAMIGSLFLIEATSRDAVMLFHKADPFYEAGIWQSITIMRFDRRRG